MQINLIYVTNEVLLIKSAIILEVLVLNSLIKNQNNSMKNNKHLHRDLDMFCLPIIFSMRLYKINSKQLGAKFYENV